MMVLKDLLTVRRDVRVVLMSATLNAQLFSEYFFDAPVIHIPGTILNTFCFQEFVSICSETLLLYELERCK